MSRDHAPGAGAIRLAAGLTTVEWHWAVDRWRHTVRLADGRSWASLEHGADAAGDDDRWPASPALVEVSLAEAGGRPVILGVGQAGRSHYAASVAPHETLADTLVFELACRIQEPPGWLGSTYRAEPAGTLLAVVAVADAAAPPRTIRWTYHVGPAGVVAVAPARVVPHGPGDA